ncbi:MAG TPA: hypothetical protein VMR31_03575 [Myxococcota bacterium]|nr:hypothetical protein [Myxococcota bacterium]
MPERVHVHGQLPDGLGGIAVARPRDRVRVPRARCRADLVPQRLCRRAVEVYDDAGRRTGVYPKRRAELISLARVWFRNIRAQGFLGADARREIIA